MRASAILLFGGGDSPATLRLDDETYLDEAVAPATATAGFTVGNDGNLTVQGYSGTNYAWLTGGTPANYEIRVTETSGSVSAGTVGSWLALSTSRNWNVSRAAVGSKTCTVTAEIGLAGTGVALETATITMTVMVTAA